MGATKPEILFSNLNFDDFVSAIFCLLLSAKKNPATHLSRTTLFWISRAYLLKRKTCSPRSTSTTAPLKSLSKGENCGKRNAHYYTSFPEKYRIDV